MKLQKWGNSAAIRLPKTLLHDLNWQIGQTIRTEVQDGRVILHSAPRPRYRLDELLNEMDTPAPRAEDWDTMPASGQEWSE